MSSLGGGNGYQALGISIPRRGLGQNDKILESEGSRPGNPGFAMTEKDIDERVCHSFALFDIWFPTDSINDVLEILGCRSRKQWRPQWKPKLPGDWRSANV